MLNSQLLEKLAHGGNVLCLGAHSDDIEIGCGGTMLRLVNEVRGLNVTWVVFCGEGDRESEARGSAEEVLSNASSADVIVKRFRNGFFPYVAADIKEYFETLKAGAAPDVVFTHYRNDLHQDHRVISDLTWNTFRNHLILEYEIPKYDGDLGSPNCFVTLDAAQLEAKQELLERHFASQRSKQWFTRSTFEGLCRIRGIECASPTGFAEAFYGRKIVIG